MLVNAPVLLLRHGESEWNVARRTQGQTHHPALTQLGRAQALEAVAVVARVLGERHARAASVVTSDLVRAHQTAEIVADLLGVELRADPRLREMALGTLEGLSYEESWKVAEEHDWTDPDLAVAGGESPRRLQRRMMTALADAAALARNGTAVVLVTHGDSIRSVDEALRTAAGRGEWLPVPNGAVFRVGDGLERLS